MGNNKTSVICFKTGRLLLVLILALVSGCLSKDYRFDYEFNEQAGGWLKFHVIPATWEKARMRCHAEGAVLASPLNHQLKSAIVSFVNKKEANNEGGISIFTGVHATFSAGDYSSVEGVPLLRLAITWAPGEPDNLENSENCLVLDTLRNGTMADSRCDYVLPYVCYKKDTKLTVTECGTTDPAPVCCLTKETVIMASVGQDMQHFDMVIYEYVDPGVISLKLFYPPTYLLESRTGSCYKFHDIGLIWSEAYMTCVAEGGYLVVINSDTEATVVREIYGRHSEGSIRSTDPYVMGIGFRDMSVHQNYMTIHGQTLDEAGYQQWSSGNPSNSSRDRIGDPGEFCGSILKDGRLNDVFCHAPIAFLCEKDPKSLR